MQLAMIGLGRMGGNMPEPAKMIAALRNGSGGHAAKKA